MKKQTKQATPKLLTRSIGNLLIEDMSGIQQKIGILGRVEDGKIRLNLLKEINTIMGKMVETAESWQNQEKEIFLNKKV